MDSLWISIAGSMIWTARRYEVHLKESADILRVIVVLIIVIITIASMMITGLPERLPYSVPLVCCRFYWHQPVSMNPCEFNSLLMFAIDN